MLTSGGNLPARGRLRLLVVDDNVDAANSLAMLLRRLGGHSVRTVYDGASALQTAREFRPDVVLLDIGMPRLDGYAVARELRTIPETADVVIIAVTGYGRSTDREQSVAAGIDLHLIKPIDTNLLLSYLSGSPDTVPPVRE